MLTLGATCNSFFFISATLFYSIVLCFQKLIIPEFISPCFVDCFNRCWRRAMRRHDEKFDDKIPKREFNNFQFVNFTEIMKRDSLRIPFQKTTGVAKKINPRPPPTPYTPTIRTELPSPAPDEHTQNSSLTFAFFFFFCRFVEIADPGYQTVPSAEY
ncbi:unnamed protein product [Brassica rapa subsp. narinosa]